jgi:hypothetical protein
MTYQITKQIKIINHEDGFGYEFSTDEDGTVSVEDYNGVTRQIIYIPKDYIQHFIDVLESLK